MCALVRKCNFAPEAHLCSLSHAPSDVRTRAHKQARCVMTMLLVFYVVRCLLPWEHCWLLFKSAFVVLRFLFEPIRSSVHRSFAGFTKPSLNLQFAGHVPVLIPAAKTENATVRKDLVIGCIAVIHLSSLDSPLLFFVRITLSGRKYLD